MSNTDKELIEWHLHQAAVNHKLAETAASTASYAHSCECEKMHRDTAARLRELVEENARLEKQYRERRDVPLENIARIAAKPDKEKGVGCD